MDGREVGRADEIRSSDGASPAQVAVLTPAALPILRHRHVTRPAHCSKSRPEALIRSIADTTGAGEAICRPSRREAASYRPAWTTQQDFLQPQGRDLNAAQLDQYLLTG